MVDERSSWGTGDYGNSLNTNVGGETYFDKSYNTNPLNAFFQSFQVKQSSICCRLINCKDGINVLHLHQRFN